MRVSTSMVYQRALQGFQQQQESLAEVQQQIASGMKYLRPSDNPSAMARSLDLEQVLSRTGQYQENIGAAENRLMLEESTLGGVEEILQRVRELTVQAGNGALSEGDLDAISSEVRERFDELVGLANTVDAHGDALFGGHQGAGNAVTSRRIGTQMFAEYTGDDGARALQIGESQRVKTSDSGADVFFRVPGSEALVTRAAATNTGSAELAPAFVYDATQATGDEYSINFTAADTYDVVNVSTGATVVAGASYTPGNPIEFDGLRASAEGVPAAGDSFSVRSGQYQDIFGTLNKLVTALESNTDTDADSARYDATIAASLSDLDNALDRVDEVRTSVGGRLNMLTSQADQNTAYELHTQRTLSDIRDLDYAEAVSRLQNDLFVLQAAQQSFARIEGNSLFNYL